MAKRGRDLPGMDQAVDINPDGSWQQRDGASRSVYTLLDNVASPASGPAVAGIRGGDYVWRCEAANWTGVTATLQFLGLDGVAWYNVRNAANTADVTLTANGQVSLGVAESSTLRVLLTGTQAAAGVRSNLAGL